MGNVLCKSAQVKNSIINFLSKILKIFFKDKGKATNEKEICDNKNARGKGIKRNYVARALYDLTKYEITLLTMALIFLSINAYTNLNYPKIMGECIESNNIKYMKCDAINNILQKINILKVLPIKANSNMNTIFFYFPCFLCGGIASYFRIYFTNKCIKNVEYRLKKKVHNKIINENGEEFKKYKSADYLVNCTFNEIKFSSKELITSITQMLRYINSIVGGMASMIFISSYLTKLCAFIVPTYGFFVLLILKKLKNIRIQTDKHEEKLMSRFSDILQKKNIISLFGNEYYEKKYFSEKLKSVNKLHQKDLNYEAMLYSFLNIGSNIVICSMLCFGKFELKNNNISHGQLVSFIAYSSMLGLGIVGILKLKKDINILHLSLKKIYEILDFSASNTASNYHDVGILAGEQSQSDIEKLQNNTEVPQNKHSKTVNTDNGYENNDDYNNVKGENCHRKQKNPNNDMNKHVLPRNIKGSIIYENVNFSYNNFDENKNQVLKNINFEIKEKEKVAIIGKSGSGKSTICKLLTGEYKYQGNIYVDNYNIKYINNIYLKKNVLSITEQECNILNRSLYENLIYGLIPVKILNEKKNPKTIFENIDPNNSLYTKILSRIINNETTSNNDVNTLINKKNISLILQNFDMEESKELDLKDKFNSYLKSSVEDNNFFSDIEKQYISKKIQNADKNVRCKNDTNSYNSNKKNLDNKNDTVIMHNYAFLKDYENNISTINSSVDVLCEELDLNTFINSMPQHIHSEVQNNSMSSGQKQRISIIRSIMRDTPIYIFDEITSFLDESNMEKVHKLINTLIPNKTIIYITHSTKILNKMDKIIIVDDGEIKLIGTHDQVKKSPLFSNIFI